MKLGDKWKAVRPQGKHKRKVLMSLAVKVDAVRSTSQRWVYLFSHSIIKIVTGLDLIQCNCSGDDDLWILDVHLGLKKIFPLCLGIRVILTPKKANIKRQLSTIYIDNGRTQILSCMKTQSEIKLSACVDQGYKGSNSFLTQCIWSWWNVPSCWAYKTFKYKNVKV